LRPPTQSRRMKSLDSARLPTIFCSSAPTGNEPAPRPRPGEHPRPGPIGALQPGERPHRPGRIHASSRSCPDRHRQESKKIHATRSRGRPTILICGVARGASNIEVPKEAGDHAPRQRPEEPGTRQCFFKIRRTKPPAARHHHWVRCVRRMDEFEAKRQIDDTRPSDCLIRRAGRHWVLRARAAVGMSQPGVA
jgi:hypothetical protein